MNRALLIGCTLVCFATGARAEDDRDFLVPEMEGRGFSIEPGDRTYENRLGFSPGIGKLGDEPYYAMRVSFNPSPYMGWEAHLGHNPSESVHALVNALHVQLRWPLPWRAQPYVSFGYGMMLVFPGRVFEADPVTENQIGAGIGLEFYLRDDVALRGEYRGTSIVGSSARQADGYDYREFTLGMVFYRTIEN